MPAKKDEAVQAEVEEVAVEAKEDEKKIEEKTEATTNDTKTSWKWSEKESKKKEEKKKEPKAKKDEKGGEDKLKSTKVPNKHWAYYNDVEVSCICGAKFTVNTTVPWPIKMETCYQCHPIYNKDKVIKKVIKWRLEKFMEKQKRMDAMKK